MTNSPSALACFKTGATVALDRLLSMIYKLGGTMFRRILALGMTVIGLAGPAVAAGHAQSSRTYKGTIHGGGRVSLTITGRSVTAINVAGTWTCENGITPISYTYTLRSTRAHPSKISAKGAFKGNHLKFASDDLHNNQGKYTGSGALSGTLEGTTVTGKVSVQGSTPDSFCGGGGGYTASLTK